MARYLEDWDRPASRFAQFYTKPNIAVACFSQLLASGVVPADAFFVEPSAGAGAFYDLLPVSRRFGCDIDPHPSCPVVKADFLSYPVDDFLARSSIVVVGNPPFGLSREHGAMCSAFFNRAVLFADVIAFILPHAYSVSAVDSWSVEFDPSFELVSQYWLPRRSFHGRDDALYGEEDFGYRCVFQIWRRSVPRSFP